jgi:hypothetical protein
MTNDFNITQGSISAPAPTSSHRMVVSNGPQGHRAADPGSVQPPPKPASPVSHCPTILQSGISHSTSGFTWPIVEPYTRYFDGDPDYQTRWPMAVYLPKVFPADLCEFIVSHDGLAAVMVEFPKNPTDTCLSLYIKEDEVSYVASRLFNIRIVVRSNCRAVAIENGPTMEINGDMVLSRAMPDAVDSFFGRPAVLAYTTSAPHQQAAKDGGCLVYCLRMTIEGNPRLPCRIRLMSGPAYLDFIRGQLWPV